VGSCNLLYCKIYQFDVVNSSYVGLDIDFMTVWQLFFLNLHAEKWIITIIHKRLTVIYLLFVF